MHTRPYKKIPLLLLLWTISVSGRHLPHRVIKRSPQLTLTVVDEDTPVRTHPPSPEDLEERRQALVNSLGGFGGAARQPTGIADLGLDIIGGVVKNSGNVFAPLRNATREAAKGLPRLGNVINGLSDGARSYSRQVAGGLRTTGGVVLNNTIKFVTAASMRGSEVLSGVFKLMRTLLDSFTRTVTSLAQSLSRGIQNATRLGSRVLATNFERARKYLSNPRILQPAKDVISIGSKLATGLTQDFTGAQSSVNEGVKSKLSLGSALIPRVRFSSFLSPLTDPESSSSSADSNSEGYNKKRESEDESEKQESQSSSQISPLEILELLDPTEEKKSNPEDHLEQSESKSVTVESQQSDGNPSTTLITDSTVPSTTVSSTISTSTTTSIPTTTSASTTFSTTPAQVSTTRSPAPTTSTSSSTTTPKPVSEATSSNELSISDFLSEDSSNPTTILTSQTTEISGATGPSQSLNQLFGI